MHFHKMPNRLKLKLSRVIPSFQICRPKSPSSLAETPIKSIHRFSSFNPNALDINYPNFPAPPPSTPHQPSIKRHVARKVVSVGCRCRSISCSHYLSDSSFESLDFARKKEANNNCQPKPHHNIHSASFFSDESNGDASPVRVTGGKKKRNKENKKDLIIASSFDGGCFSSDDVVEENEETETLLISSRSFSYDSSCEFSHSLDRIAEKTNNETKREKKKASSVKRVRNLGRQVSRKWKRSSKTVSLSPEITSPVRTSVLRRMISCTVDGKVRESMAIVKKSEDPYKDFKRSMLEMILEKQMFEAEDLEELLQCFLSLNSRQYHGVIVEAFSEIWEILYCDSPVQKRASVRL